MQNPFKKKDEAQEPKKYKNAFDLIGSLMQKGMLAMSMAATKPEAERGKYMGDQLKPFMTLDNAALIFTDTNISKIKEAIINRGLPNLGQHYILSLEPTEDFKDVICRIYTRQPLEPGLGAQVPQLQHTFFLSELNQQKLFSFLSKFKPNDAGTAK